MEARDSYFPRALDDERRVDAWTVLVSAMCAGLAFLLVVWLGYVLSPGARVWNTPLRIASLALGERGDGPAVEAETASPTILVLAVGIHALLSLVFALFVALPTRRLPIPYDFVAGAVLGAIVYVVDYHGLTPVAPAVAEERGPVSLAAHLVFGVTVVAVHAVLRARPGTNAALPRSREA
jgi:hypothetical protein